ncbi:MAG: twin-arginine translocase TatA/TatE family subunit [Rhizobiaceae bacterium]|nr:MAG: twin-arginine translocase TatA/TatE family subunit [Rhizobiaceae bacterium]
MFDIGLPELIIILVILLLLFGAKRLPKLSRSLGQSARELRDGFTGEKKETKTEPKPRGTGEGPSSA